MRAMFCHVLILIVGLGLAGPAAANPIGGDCSFNGRKLHGKIQVVTSFPDAKVQVVTSFPDIKVKVVDAFPDNCGEWQMVTSFPNTKIQFVTSFPDVKIQYVTSFPGLN